MAVGERSECKVKFSSIIPGFYGFLMIVSVRGRSRKERRGDNSSRPVVSRDRGRDTRVRGSARLSNGSACHWRSDPISLIDLYLPTGYIRELRSRREDKDGTERTEIFRTPVSRNLV